MNKICFIASSGGHFEQLMMLRPLMDKYESFIVTEKTGYFVINDNRKIYYLSQVYKKFKFIYKGKTRCSNFYWGFSNYTNVYICKDF